MSTRHLVKLRCRCSSCLQILVEGPASKEKVAVPRHSAALANVVLTPIVISKLPRGARSGVVKKEWLKEEVDKKWEASAWAKKREQKERRRGLTDFERFKVLKLRKQVGLSFPTFCFGRSAIWRHTAG